MFAGMVWERVTTERKAGGTAHGGITVKDRANIEKYKDQLRKFP